MVSKPFTPSTFGKYYLVERIASGGMAEVFRAILRGAAGFEKTVALKRILPFFGDDPAFVTLFQDEARIVSTLSHANIAHVFDFGEVDGSYYLTMEHVEGIDLAHLGERMAEAKQPMPLATAAFVVAEAARGLAYAHEKKGADGQTLGIVHRDVSPQNILISYEGEVKVTDFGIAKAAGKAHKTATGVVMGKLKYMSPEQVGGKELDPRSDIFSLGVILYELVTGGPLFPGEETVRLAELIHTAEIPPPSKRSPGVPPELDAIVLKMLQRSREERYGRAAELARDLSVFVNQHSPGFTREDLAALVRHLAPRPVTSPATAGWDATRDTQERSALAVAPTQLTPTPARAASDTSVEVPSTRRTPGPTSGEGTAGSASGAAADGPRQLDLPTRTRFPDEGKISTEPVKAPEPQRKKKVSKEAWIGLILGVVILASGGLVALRFVLPGDDAERSPDARIASRPGDGGAAIVPAETDAGAPRLSEARRRELEGRLNGLQVARRGLPQFPEYLVFLTALDWELAHLVTDDAGALEPGTDPLPTALQEKLQRYGEVKPALEVVSEYYRGMEELPALVALPLKGFLERRGAWSRGDPGWGAAALAIALQGSSPERLVALAHENDALGGWCAPPPAPKRHRDPTLCEPGALAAALRAAGQGAVADAVERWHAAGDDASVKLGGAPVKIRGRSQSGNLDGSWSFVLTIVGPDNLAGKLSVSGTEIAGKKEAPAATPSDGGTSEGVRITFDEVPKDFFAPVLELASGGEKVRIRLRPPSLL